MPRLGIPKDKYAFQYAYFDKVQSPEENNFLHKPIDRIERAATTMNYTYETKDMITHQALNPNFIHLNH